MRERRLQKYVLDNVDDTGHWTFIESKDVSPGIPDLNFCVNSIDGWIELKYGTDKNPPTLRPTQCAWFRRRAGVGGNCWLLMGAPFYEAHSFYLIPGIQVPGLVKATKLDHWKKEAQIKWDGRINWKEFIDICTTLG